MMYGVTGATGELGSLVVSQLINLGVQPSSIIGLARNRSKAEHLEKQGITVRIGDYDDQDSLRKAFIGVDRLLLISSSEVGKRATQHQNVIEAAQDAGTKTILYTSITRADTSDNPLSPEHRATEELLRHSGLSFVILRNNWYAENYTGDIRAARDSGTIAAAAEDGKVASASKSDYAEAAAKALVSESYDGMTLELAGAPWNYEQLASAAGKVLGKDIRYERISVEERKQRLVAAGMPEAGAAFYAQLDESIAAGTLDISSSDLEKVLERSPLSLEEQVKKLL
ncbi:SDR family oxidoreductase [Sediminispirochaeta bajacaliforniensis]|uniref:SDR family oxidoreductase n=1 Tax=Sediminispirochaeta bajacaliforniensis TaxID=148 RepID=UPI00036FBB15|nr:SDR family oxidoreductase [Sediminispirochaeta bajacaliforniensis]